MQWVPTCFCSNTWSLRIFWWEQFKYPPHNPDLEWSDCLLFRYLKLFLSGQQLNVGMEVEMAVKMQLYSQAAVFYEERLQNSWGIAKNVSTTRKLCRKLEKESCKK